MTPPRSVEDAASYRDGCLLFQCQQQFPQYLAGRGRGNAALVEHGGQLVHVRANDVAFVTVRMAPSSCKKLTPPASGVPVPGKADGSRQSKSMVR